MLIQLQPEGHPLSLQPHFLLFFILTKQPCDYTLVSIFIFLPRDQARSGSQLFDGTEVGSLLLRTLNSM